MDGQGQSPTVRRAPSLVALAAFYLLSIFFAIWGVTFLVDFGIRKNTAETPSITPPPDSTIKPEPPVQEELRRVALIEPSDNFTVSENPYLGANYEAMSRELALVGDFDTAQLKVIGVVPTEQEHFLSLNVGTESGIYNAVRNSASGLDLSLTKQSLGTFDKNNPINITLNLKADQSMAPTTQEYLSTRNSTKLVKFWNFIRPQTPKPSVNRVLAAPFNRNGVYAGQIQALVFEYTCQLGKHCDAGTCQANEKATACLDRLFGPEAAKQWEEWYRTGQ